MQSWRAAEGEMEEVDEADIAAGEATDIYQEIKELYDVERELPRWDPGFACLFDDRQRPVVYHVDKNSPADRGGFRVGMTVVSVDGRHR